jgi:hypothetical protein
MRDTGRMTQLIDDFRHLGQWLRGEWEPLSERTMPAPMKYELLHGELNGMHPRIAIDTEKHGNAPWSVQWSGRPGTGYMLLAEDGRGIGKFAAWIREYPETGVILHNAPGDLDTLDALGIHIGTGQFRDTMQEAYQLCSLPQGLKALAYRTLGVEMRSWEDVVWPASIDKLVRWMADALQLVGVDQRFSTTVTTPLTMGKCPACGTRGKGTNCKVCGEFISKVKVEHVPTAAAGILAHVLRHTVETAADEADEPYNPWRAMERMRVEGLRGKRAEGWEWDVLAETLGEPPILGIGNCELADAVEYGCGDADMTGQVAAVMERERQSDRWKIDDADKDR